MKKLVALGLFTLIFAFGQAQGRFEDEGTETEEQASQTEQKSQPVNAKPTQQSSRSNFWDRTRFGGNLGLSFGTFTYINVSPRMYYLATEKLWLGAGFRTAFAAFVDYNGSSSSHSSVNTLMVYHFKMGARLGFSYDFTLNEINQT